MGGQHDLGARVGDEAAQEIDLSLSVRGEVVDRDDDGYAVDIAHILDVAPKIDDALLERAEILVGDRLEVGAAVVLEGADGRHDDRG